MIRPGRVFGEENWLYKWAGERSMCLSGAVSSGKLIGDDVEVRGNGLMSCRLCSNRTRVLCES